MRLAVCALSAVLLSGCSWLGMGGHGSAGGSYGVNCAPSGTGYYNGGDACGVGGGYSVGGYDAGAGYGTGAGYGAGAGYGTGAGYGSALGGMDAGLAANGVGGMYGANGANGYAIEGFQGAYGANGAVTTLGTNAAYGSAVYGQNVVGTQYANGQYVQGAGVQTVQGAPYYVPQPYPAYYGVPQLRGVGAALPWGVELAAGTEFNLGGKIFTAKEPGSALGSTSVNTGGSDGISYSDAFGKMKTIGGALSYDVSRNTTVLGGVTYGSANGQTAEAYQSVDARSPGTLEDIDAEFSDLNMWTIEGGVRQYMGYNPTFRPYVGASAGFTHNNSVDIQRKYSSDGADYDAEPFEYVQSGWNPTAAATIGAEMAVGPRAAIGVESGIRWRDNMNANLDSEDRWSVPLKLRGRVAF